LILSHFALSLLYFCFHFLPIIFYFSIHIFILSPKINSAYFLHSSLPTFSFFVFYIFIYEVGMSVINNNKNFQISYCFRFLSSHSTFPSFFLSSFLLNTLNSSTLVCFLFLHLFPTIIYKLFSHRFSLS
jgi:hypothetical protein